MLIQNQDACFSQNMFLKFFSFSVPVSIEARRHEQNQSCSLLFFARGGWYVAFHLKCSFLSCISWLPCRNLPPPDPNKVAADAHAPPRPNPWQLLRRSLSRSPCPRPLPDHSLLYPTRLPSMSAPSRAPARTPKPNCKAVASIWYTLFGIHKYTLLPVQLPALTTTSLLFAALWSMGVAFDPLLPAQLPAQATQNGRLVRGFRGG